MCCIASVRACQRGSRVGAAGVACFLALAGLLVEPACTSAAHDDGVVTFPASALATVQGEAGAVTFEVRTSPDPPQRGEVALELRVRDAKGVPRDALTITVVPWMPAHGHGSATKPIVTPQGQGIYRVDQVMLGMPGTWELRMQLSGPGIEDRATLPIDVR